MHWDSVYDSIGVVYIQKSQWL